jgi:hypothetical protein
VNATFAQARERSEGGVREDLPVSAKIFGNAHAAYSLGQSLPTFGLAGSYIARRLANKAIDGQFVPTPFAPSQLELRATVSGQVPRLEGLSYRVIGSHITAESGAYAVGPAQQATPNQPSAVLNPLKQYEVFWELSYDF